MGGEDDTGPVKLSRLAAAGGIAGPVLFTVAWVVSSLRQAGHSAVEVQLSGLAAEDARDPRIMMAGFVLLGAGTVVFGAGLGRVAASRSAGPWLVLVAGAASVAAGLFRRDHMLLAGPGFAGESWHNQVHDVVSGIAYGAMLAAPLALARRWHDDPDWAHLSRPVQALTLASAAALAVFASRRTSALMFRRVTAWPVLPRMDLAAQRRRTMSRCQRSMVSGVTSSRSPWRRAFGITPSRVASRARSAQFSFGRRGWRRCSTASWWRRIKISAIRHVSSRRDSCSHEVVRVIRRKTTAGP